jgi:hypothetical protein
MIDSLLCIGLPLLQVVACTFPVLYSSHVHPLNLFPDYVVQGHRFNIFEDIGCYPATVNTIPTIFLLEIWPIVIGLVSGTYCGTSCSILCCCISSYSVSSLLPHCSHETPGPVQSILVNQQGYLPEPLHASHDASFYRHHVHCATRHLCSHPERR